MSLCNLIVAVALCTGAQGRHGGQDVVNKHQSSDVSAEIYATPSLDVSVPRRLDAPEPKKGKGKAKGKSKGDVSTEWWWKGGKGGPRPRGFSGAAHFRGLAGSA